MYFNMFLKQFGFNPDDFVDQPIEPIEENGKLVYYLDQKYNGQECPKCHKNDVHIHSHSTQIKVMKYGPDVTCFHIDRIRVKCKHCNKVFMLPLAGIRERFKVPSIIINQIVDDFKRTISFKDIAKKYGLSTTTVIKIFDSTITDIRAKPLPRVLCIDEKYFLHDEGKFVTVLSNYETGEIIDILKDRKDAYLDDYFRKIPEGQRKKVKIFICDMYSGYARAHSIFFPKSTLVIDLFHTVTQLKLAVSNLRVKVMKSIEFSDPDYYAFMKKHWRIFEMRNSDIPNVYYILENKDKVFYSNMVVRCCSKSTILSTAYNALQELYSYPMYRTYTKAYEFMDLIIKNLEDSKDALLVKVANTYRRWKVPICEGMVVREGNFRYTNGIAEGNNSCISRIINVSYGYRNFERFRKRTLLIKAHLN